MNARPLIAFLLCACSAAACMTGKLDVGTNDGGLGACQATCSTPAGAVQDTTSLEQAYAQVQGAWLFCNGKDRFAGAPADAIGVEFAPVLTQVVSCGGGGGQCGEGQFYYLTEGPNGPVRGSGFAYQLTYDISQEGATSYQLNIHPAPNAGFGGSFVYSPCPKELELPGFNYATMPPVLIAIDGAGAPDDAGVQPVSDSGGTSDGAACPPAGPEQPVTTVADAETDVAGRWQICTGLDVLRKYAGANDIIGMEFGPASDGGGYCSASDTSCAGGDLYYLVPGSTGPVRGQGFPYQAKYELTGTGKGLELDLSPAPNGGWTSSILYSPSPRELDITQLDYMNGPTMVAIP